MAHLFTLLSLWLMRFVAAPSASAWVDRQSAAEAVASAWSADNARQEDFWQEPDPVPAL